MLWLFEVPMSLDNTLADVPLFRGLDESELGRIEEIGRIEYFNAGSTVMAQGELGPRLLVVLEGRVDILKTDAAGIERSIGQAAAGEVLGEISLLLDLPRSATVRALEDLRCFAMNRASFREMVDTGDPAALKIGMALARSLAARLVLLNDRVLDLLSATEDGTRLEDRFASERQSLFRLWN